MLYSLTLMLDSIVALWINEVGLEHRQWEKWSTTQRAIQERMYFGDGEVFVPPIVSTRLGFLCLVLSPIL